MNLWWILLIVISLSMSAAGFLFLISRFAKFPWVERLARGSRIRRFLISSVFPLTGAVILWRLFGMVNVMICVLHLDVFWILADITGGIVQKFRKKQPQKTASGQPWEKQPRKPVYIPGICALLLTAGYLGYAWYTAHHVIRTDYELQTEKDLGGEPLKIVMFGDSHVGSTFHADRFTEYCREMEACNPDLLVVAGDFVDDDTTKEDMAASCEALGSIQTKYGVYFVYGNHDRGYYGSEYRDYSGADLTGELLKNGVRILQDEAVLIDDRFYLIGREDARMLYRSDMESLMEGLDPEKYIVVADHQPHDYEAQAECGVDLVLSGHTHGGWMIPINQLAVWTGTDDQAYGHEKRGQTDFIVTSGISEWELKFKSGTVSEYVVITVSD